MLNTPQPLPAADLARHARLLELLRSDAAPDPRQASYLLRVNLAPRMGRRDAALDRAEQLILSPDFDPENDTLRVEYLAAITRLLGEAERDTLEMLRLYTSPDTARRERWMGRFLLQLHSLTQSLFYFYEMEQEVLSGRTGSRSELLPAPGGTPAEKLFGVSAQAMLAELRRDLEHARKSVRRYRNYMTKNFSAENAERYQKSFRSYLKIYAASAPELQ